MKVTKINEAAHNHIFFGELIYSVKRLMKAYQIWRIDCRYRAMGDYVAALKRSQDETERLRRALLIRRADLRTEMLSFGSIEQ